MNKLTSFAVHRPVTTLMFFVAVFVLGGTAFLRLPVDLFPDVDPPVITVFTSYSGAGAEDVETNITRVLEEGLSTLTGLDKITSTSEDNFSSVVLEFTYETDLNEAANDIRDAIARQQRLLPDDAENPIIFKFNTGLFPVVVLSATADESFPELDRIIEDRVVTALNRIPGVGAVNVSGGPVRQVRVDLDPNRLEAFGMTVPQITQALHNNNQNIPAGSINMGRMEYNLRVEGELNDPEAFRNIIVGQNEGRLIYLSDVATVYDGMMERTMHEKINGKEGVRIRVQKQANANTVSVAREVFKRLPEIQAQLPPDVELGTVVDTSTFIVNSISNLGQVLIFGGVFIIVVVLFFLKRWRSTFIVFLTIPFSLIVALIYLYISDNSLNLISLSSLAIAMGMVVDDAIVILENITSYTEKGSRPKEAAIFGSNEVGLAVVATTLTVVAVFLPLAFLTGMTGVLFKQLGIIVSLTVVTSTVAALTLTPMLASRLLKSKKRQVQEKKPSRFDVWSDSVFKSWEDAYGGFVQGALKYKKLTLFASLAIFIGSLFLVPYIGTEFIAESDNGRVTLNIELETGRRLEESDKIAARIEDHLKKTYGKDLEVISTSVGRDDQGVRMGNAQQGSHILNLTLGFVEKGLRDKSVFEISEEIRDFVYSIPGVIKVNLGSGGGLGAMFGGAGGSGKPIELKVIGHDFETTSLFSDSLMRLIRQVPGTRDVESSRGSDRPQLKVVLDREKMALAGLNASTVGNAVRHLVAGTAATKYRESGNEYDVFIRYKPEFRSSISDIENISIVNAAGQSVKLKEIGRVEEEFAPLVVERLNRERVITLSAGLHGRALGSITSDIENLIEKVDLPAGVYLEFGGQVENQQDAFGDMFMLLLLSVMLVYMVMAAQFESLVDPFIIMFSLPFAFSGVLLSLFVSNTPLGILALLGGIILVGIVVKNAIVLVDYINLMRNRGMSMNEAIVASGRSRLRPVLMTTFTTILAMLPMVFSIGEGSEIWQPMGIAVTGGLIFSTLITMVLVPVLYAIMKRKNKAKMNLQDL
ncbi:efflux RND transporter permease subunit [Cytophagaceae bacterium ABcell3]|nr:efflux RND transporter permease subunit [Cytophagaceae bacterium ABcell3]